MQKLDKKLDKFVKDHLSSLEYVMTNEDEEQKEYRHAVMIATIKYIKENEYK